MSLPGVWILMSAWDEPKAGGEVYLQRDRAIRSLQEIHEAVRAIAGEGPANLMELTRKTAAALGLPPQAATPMLARTFAANLAVRDRESLLSDSP